ncbi:MAG: ankyrin repeat domain-containing protein [Verrucomicrobiales bacterium]|nr:ankyrin repeat domain-containing protein [Verrucomicrobiales bacterium]
MVRQRMSLSADTKEALELIRKGNLFEVIDWISSGNKLQRPELGSWNGLLYKAVETGFHSMVKILLEKQKWEPDDLACALARAFQDNRVDIAELLLEYNAPTEQVGFDEVCRTMDKGLIERMLRLGVDPCNEDSGFAYALNKFKARPLLRVYRELRQEFPCLHEQASLALRQAIENQNPRWTAMLAWAGADPWYKTESE